MGDNWGNHVAIVVEGILKTPNDSSSVMSGVLLYKSLVKDHRVSLIIDSPRKESSQYWLLMNSFIDHVKEIYREVDDPEDIADRRLMQIARLKADGPVSAVFESDAEAAAALLEYGVPAFLYLHPQYTHPEHRPDAQGELTPWSQIMAEQVRQKEARAADIRLKKVDE